ncbi:MAG: glycosyltransferase family 39 protein [Candidatus Pacearchaeota archaeon]
MQEIKEESEKTGENLIEEKKGKIAKWLKDPYNLTLVGILAFAFAIRLYYFFMVNGQALWWDSACYGALAKNFAFHRWDNTTLVLGESVIRPLLFPLVWSLFVMLGVNETGVNFLLELIPSTITIFAVYLVGKEMYNKKVGLISAVIFSVLWMHLFYTYRFLADLPALPLLFFSIYYFVKANKEKLDMKYLFISLFLLSLATLTRYPIGATFFVYLIVLILNKNLLLANKKFWIAGILGILPILIFFILNFVYFDNIFPALLGGQYLKSPGAKAGTGPSPFDWTPVTFPHYFLQNTFFVFFVLGLGLMLFELVAGYNFIHKNKKLQNHLILLLLIMFISLFFIFYLRACEDRWMFPTTITMAVVAGFGLGFVCDSIKKYNKFIAILLIIAILLFGAYFQLKSADYLIKERKDSFKEIREGFEWLASIESKNITVAGTGIEPYAVYYSEFNYLPIPANKSDSGEIAKADYLVIHAFTPQATYINEYLSENQDIWIPINGYFFDKERTQVAFVIYKNQKLIS